MARFMMIVMLVILLTACDAFSNDDGGNNGGGNSGNNSNNGSDVINWTDDSGTIIFRAEITGGDDANAIYRKNDVPLCTIYGDGRLVWARTDQGETDVLFDVLDDSTIRRFVSDLTIQQQIYSLDSEAGLAIPSENSPVVEQVTLTVNGVTHVTDSFSDWSDEFFGTVLDMCQGLADSPAIFEPDAAWISAEIVDVDSNTPQVFWDAEASGLDLLDTTGGQRKWITGPLVPILWKVLRETSPDTVFNQDGNNVQIALEVPYVTVSSPPPQVETPATDEGS